MSKPRSWSRRLALQALYQWQMTGQSALDIGKQFVEEQEIGKADMEYFEELLQKVPQCVESLDAHIAPLLDRPVRELDPVELAILRLGTYELEHRKDVPYRVVINESIELAKTFGADQGHKYVNSILDGVAKKVRAAEVNAVRKK